MISSSSKFYIRFRENIPESALIAHAYCGFNEMGAQIVPYYWIDDIDSIQDLGPETGVVGYIGDVHRGLKKNWSKDFRTLGLSR